MKKCDYCGKQISYSEQYCSGECESNALKYYRLESKHKGIFGAINIICIVSIVFACFAGLIVSPKIGGAAVSACLAVLGITVIALPMATLNLIKKLKIKKAVLITRIFGAFLVALGILVLVIYVL